MDEKKEFNLNIKDELEEIPDYDEKFVKSSLKVKKKKPTYVKVIIAVSLLVCALALSLASIFAMQDIFAFGKPDQEIVIKIEDGWGMKQVAQELEDKGVIKSAFAFRVYQKLSRLNINYYPIEYTLNSNMSYGTIADQISQYGRSNEEVRVVITEGMTIYKIAQKLEEKEVCSADAFVAALNKGEYNYAFLKELEENPLRFHKLEGYVFPDTYFFYKGDNPANVVKKILGNTNAKLTPELIGKIKEKGMTLNEFMTVASIVQNEAIKEKDMRLVASVYYNRLADKGTYPMLQACPTTNYANQLKLQMSTIDQKVLDAYNTYKGEGLPPGPICNPGMAAINNTLNPEKTKYYFFCTSPKTKQFYYGKTFEEHKANIIKAGINKE